MILPTSTPGTYGECLDQGLGDSTPCPHERCAYHLRHEYGHGTQVPVRGRTTHFATSPPPLEALPATCALRVADRGGATLEDVGTVLGVTRERVRQIESSALRKLSRASKALEDFRGTTRDTSDEYELRHK